MFNFKDYFKDEYQFSLENVSYSKVESKEVVSEYELNVSDTINVKLDECLLNITFNREVYFIPTSMFNLKVTFAIILYLKEDAKGKADSVNWNQIFFENPNIYMGNVASRASHLIAEITASFGQQPLITQPNPILAE